MVAEGSINSGSVGEVSDGINNGDKEVTVRRCDCNFSGGNKGVATGVTAG